MHLAFVAFAAGVRAARVVQQRGGVDDLQVRAFFLAEALGNPIDPHNMVKTMYRVIARVIRAGLLNAQFHYNLGSWMIPRMFPRIASIIKINTIVRITRHASLKTSRSTQTIAATPAMRMAKLINWRVSSGSIFT